MKKYVAGFLVLAAVAGSSGAAAREARAQGIDLRQLVEILIAIGAIGPDKAAQARAAVGAVVSVQSPAASTPSAQTEPAQATGSVGNGIITAMDLPKLAEFGELVRPSNGKPYVSIDMGDANEVRVTVRASTFSMTGSWGHLKKSGSINQEFERPSTYTITTVSYDKKGKVLGEKVQTVVVE